MRPSRRPARRSVCSRDAPSTARRSAAPFEWDRIRQCGALLRSRTGQGQGDDVKGVAGVGAEPGRLRERTITFVNSKNDPGQPSIITSGVAFGFEDR